jgi:serine/threonine protein kinase
MQISPPDRPATTVSYRILKDRYEIWGLCGTGGMAEVYRGYDRSLARPVAIKLLSNLKSVSLLERFEREAHILSKLHHPNIATIFDFGVDDSQPFMVMEFVDGVSLYDCILNPKGMPLERALTLIQQIGAGLAVAHEHGVIHRDIKPENILLCQKNAQESARLIDFGLAVTDLQIKSNDRLTMHGYMLGTRRYMPPEQLQGKKPTPAADIYSFGLVCAELLAGSKAHADGLLAAQMPSIPDLDIYWPILQKACHVDQSQRWRSVREMLSAFQRAAAAPTFARKKIQLRKATSHVAHIVLGHRPVQRVLSIVALFLVGVFLFQNFFKSPVDKIPTVTLEKIGVSWLPKNELRVHVQGNVSGINSAHIIVETSIHDAKGQAIPDPESTVIDKTLFATSTFEITQARQPFDGEFRFQLPSKNTKGSIQVRILDENRLILSQQSEEFAKPKAVTRK